MFTRIRVLKFKFPNSPHGEPSSGEGRGRRRLGSMAPVNRLAPQGLDSLGHGPERLLGSLGDHTGGQIAISDGVVEIARASADASTAVEAVPSSDRTPISNMVSASGTT